MNEKQTMIVGGRSRQREHEEGGKESMNKKKTKLMWRRRRQGKHEE
jgi:hypothetical protein